MLSCEIISLYLVSAFSDAPSYATLQQVSSIRSSLSLSVLLCLGVECNKFKLYRQDVVTSLPLNVVAKQNIILRWVF